MDVILSAINDNIVEILTVILTFIAGYIGKIYKQKVTDEKTKNIIKATVEYVEQVGKEFGSEQKLELAKKKALEWLASKNIKISDTELEILIESTVNSFNSK